MKPTQDQEHELLQRHLNLTVGVHAPANIAYLRFKWWNRDVSPDIAIHNYLTPDHWSYKKEVPVDDIVKALNDFLADAGATMMQAEADRLAAEEPDDYGVLLGPEDDEE